MIDSVDVVRGDVWFVDLNPTRGREHAGIRPALILSANLFNSGPAELIVAVPITSRRKNIRWHVEIVPPEAGLDLPSFIKCEDIRSISKDRLVRRSGRATEDTIEAVAERIRILLAL